MVVVVRFGLFHESERTCDPEIEKCSYHTQVIDEQDCHLGPIWPNKRHCLDLVVCDTARTCAKRILTSLRQCYRVHTVTT